MSLMNGIRPTPNSFTFSAPYGIQTSNWVTRGQDDQTPPRFGRPTSWLKFEICAWTVTAATTEKQQSGRKSHENPQANAE
jgi:hypothetical protein